LHLLPFQIKEKEKQRTTKKTMQKETDSNFDFPSEIRANYIKPHRHGMFIGNENLIGSGRSGLCAAHDG
jgi:hypothetical protein